jgi:transposase
MRPPPLVRDWLKSSEFAGWVRAAADVETHTRRLAITLVACERLHVPAVARMLFVAPRSVERWLAQYHADGPSAVDLQPRGGRRDAYLTFDAEATLLAPFHAPALRGELLTARAIRAAVEHAVGQPVSTKYLRDLLRRHDWRKLTPRPHHPKADPARQARYKKFSSPHSRRGETCADEYATAVAFRG